MSYQCVVELKKRPKGLHLVTDEINDEIDRLLDQSPAKWPNTGVLHLFIQHTSASLLIQENADPTARQDLEEFLNRLAPENQNWHRHTAEGPDDTTAHLKSAVTPTSLTVPIVDGRLGLGTWQGLYLWEHRDHARSRRVVVTLLSSEGTSS